MTEVIQLNIIENIWKKNFQKMKPELSHVGNSLHSIYVVLGIINNSEMVESISKGYA